MMRSRSIKLWLCLACLSHALGAPAPPVQLDIIDMAAISRMTPQQLEKLAEGLAAEEIMRHKRSSAQALTSVVSKASSGLQSKVSLLGQASAGAASFISAASSKSGHGHEGYSYEPEHTKVDFWGLKKSILYTLFQAVKAITGGVTILKGQLIKGGGALASTLGKVISSKGDVVSNIGKKIVSSAALSEKKPSHPPVYGPPAHTEYGPPTAYGAPTAPAHYTAPSAPSGFTSHKYPAHLDGRNKLNGVHAGVVILTPLAGEGAHEESLHTAHSGHTSLEPPPSIIHSVYSAVKNVFSPTPAFYAADEPILTHQPPPPVQPIPSFKPMSWGAVNSYGEPAAVDTFSDYDPRNPHPPFDFAAPKLSKAPPTAPIYPKPGLTPEKIQKIRNNIKKVEAYMNNNNIQRSSEVLHLNHQFSDMLKKGHLPLFPTPVVTDNEIGVLPGELLPEPSPQPTTSTTSITTTSTTTAPTTTLQANKTTTEVTTSNRRKKDVKYFLRGNKIVQV